MNENKLARASEPEASERSQYHNMAQRRHTRGLVNMEQHALHGIDGNRRQCQ